MRAIIIKKSGKDDILTLGDVPTPIPAPNQLLVRVKAAALNRADLLQRRGKYPPPPGESPILGLEIAGDVEKIGQQVTQFKPGDAVFGLVGGGGYAEYCLLDAECALAIPENLSYIEAASIPEAFLTACEAIFTLGQLQANETILIHAGTSGVGTAGIQLATAAGARVFTTVRSSDKIAKLNTLNPAEIIHSQQCDFAHEIEKLTQGRGVDVIIDFIGANYFEKNIQSLGVGGRLICVGLMGGTTAEINLNAILTKRLQIKGLRMRTRALEDKRAMTKQFKDKWLPFLVDRTIYPVIDCVFPLEQAQNAHEYMEKNLNMGKIILEA